MTVLGSLNIGTNHFIIHYILDNEMLLNQINNNFNR